MLNPSLMDESDLIAPEVSQACQKRIDDATTRIMAEYEIERVRRNESVIVCSPISAFAPPPPVADETIHLQRRATDIAIATTKILMETTESTHILLLAALSVLRVVVKGLAVSLSHARSYAPRCFQIPSAHLSHQNILSDQKFASVL